jgi:tRNA (guanine26-N2/guanine27-N2)-dimethyltransferase
LRIFEGLAATGLRSIRYALELGEDVVREVVSNDMDPNVVESMKRNVAHNGPLAQKLITPTCQDARIPLLTAGSNAWMKKQYQELYDVVDLDPYGAPVTLLDAGVQAVVDGGLLCVTATDMATLCGNNGEACYAKYGSYPIHKSYGHEQAVRIVLCAIQNSAARHKRYIEPLLCVHMDFYVRLFMRVHTSRQVVKDTSLRTSMLYHSIGSHAFTLTPVGQKTPNRRNVLTYKPAGGKREEKKKREEKRRAEKRREEKRREEKRREEKRRKEKRREENPTR